MKARLEALLAREGSTRAVALVRIGIATLLLAEWAAEARLLEDARPVAALVHVAFYATTIAMLLGLWSRAAALATAILGGILIGNPLGLLTAGLGHHHTYLLVYVAALLALTPCGLSYSWDRLRAVRRAESAGLPPPPERGPLWGVALVGAQLSAVYFWGAIHKVVTPSMRNGERMEQILMSLYFGSDRPAIPGFQMLCAAVLLGTALLELALAIGLWFPRVRRPLIVAGLLLHAGIYFTMPVATFSATSVLLYLVFLDPERVHSVLDRAAGGGATTRP